MCSLTALVLILNCQSVWQNSINTNYHIYEICFFQIVIYCFYYPAKYGIKNRQGQRAIALSGVYLWILSIMLLFSVSSENVIRFLSRYLIFPLFLFVFASRASHHKKMMIFSKFVKWVTIIAWISVIFWMLSTFGLVSPTGYIKTGWMGNYDSYYGLYFSNNLQRLEFLINLRRNIGIFTEGPMYMLVLTFSLLFAQMLNDTYPVKKKQLVGIIAALVLTGSITGYLIFVFIVGMQLIHRFRNYPSKIIIGMIGVVIGIIATYFLLMAKSHTMSYELRMDDIYAGFNTWLQKPFIGNGYENIGEISTFMSANRGGNMGFSNTLFAVLAYGGIIFAIPFVFPIVVGLSTARRTHDYKLAVFCIVYFLLYFAVVFYTFYINFLIWAFLLIISGERIKRKDWKIVSISRFDHNIIVL